MCCDNVCSRLKVTSEQRSRVVHVVEQIDRDDSSKGIYMQVFFKPRFQLTKGIL